MTTSSKIIIDKDQSRSLARATAKIEELERKLRESEVDLQAECEALYQQHSLLKELCEKERQENAKLKEDIEEGSRHRKQLERVVQFLRTRADEAKLETLNLQKEYSPTQEKEQALAEVQKLQAELLKQTELTGKLQEEFNAIGEERIRLERSKEALQTAVEEKEQALRLAQQHLAKKMKEAAYFNERCEETLKRANELQQALIESQAKLGTSQQNLELQISNERRVQEQLRDSLKTVEAQAKKWEEKYFQLHEKFQELDMRNRSLQGLEERHHQLQMILANLGTVVGNPGSSPYKDPPRDHHWH